MKIKTLFALSIYRATFETPEQVQLGLKENKPDCIMLEYDFMPNDIHARIKEIKTNNPGVKLLMMGVYNVLEIAETFIKSGADGYYDQHCFDGLNGLAITLHNIKSGIPVIKPSTHQRKSYS